MREALLKYVKIFKKGNLEYFPAIRLLEIVRNDNRK